MSAAAATMTHSPTYAIVFREIPIKALYPSPLNPRKTLSQPALEELAESIRDKGVIEPLVVRAEPDGDSERPRFEIVAGERRYRAAMLANLTALPCVVRTLTDAEVVEHALTENHQRADVHPLEEAEAIQQLLDLDTAYTIAGVAAKLGVSKSWVYGRLKLLKMDDQAREAYRAGAITAEHADLLAAVPAHQQAAALDACFSNIFYEEPEVDEDGGEIDPPYSAREALAKSRWDLLASCLQSAASLKRWIARHTTADIADDAVQQAMPELEVAIADAAAEASKLLQVSLDPGLNETAAKDLGVIRRGRWIEVNEDARDEPGEVSSARCEHMQSAVVTHPVTPGTLRVVTVCIKRSCPVHRPAPTKAEATPADPRTAAREQKAAEQRAAAEAEAQERARVWAEVQRPKYLAALAALVAKERTLTPDIVRLATDQWHLDQVKELYGIELTPKTALTVLILASGPTGTWQTSRDSAQLAEFGKAFGLTPAQWEKQQKAAGKGKPATKPTKTTKAKPAAKKKGGR